MRYALLVVVLLLAACSRSRAPENPAPPTHTPADLAAHSEEFKRQVIKVTDGVYCAVGFSAANAIMLEGSDGVIIVDTTISSEDARAVLAEFRKITDKPVRAIVYTHSHPDHTGGAAVFAEGAPEGLKIIAQEGVIKTADKLATEFQTILTRRAMRMYGSKLTAEEMVNVGLGPYIGFTDDTHIHLLRPNVSFAEEMEDTIGGVHFKLIHAPGETDDTLFLWMPEKRVLLVGDDIYKAFPNLYTIRGTTYRDLKGWAASLDKARTLKPAFIVPSHTKPFEGEQNIYETLTAYRDAIRYVYEQTVRMINQGKTPDEIVATLRLPAHLAQHPYLQEFYGTARWSARSVFNGNLGWFDGNVTTLDPLAPDDEARKFVDLAGGAQALAQKITDAEQRGEHQWVLQLSDRLLRVDPDNDAVKQARFAALTALGSAASNPNARHYYLTTAHELHDGLQLPARFAQPEPGMIHDMPVAPFFDALAVNLHAEDTIDLDQKVGFTFTDTGESYTLWIRHGVTEVQPRLLENLDLEVKVSSQAFKEMLAQLRKPALSLATDFEVVKGNKLGLIGFFKRFEPGT